MENDLAIPENTLVVIPAASKGTRMGRSREQHD